MVILGNSRIIFIVQKIKIMIQIYISVTTIASLEPSNKTKGGVEIITLTLTRTD